MAAKRAQNQAKMKQFELAPEQKQEIREAFDLFDVRFMGLFIGFLTVVVFKDGRLRDH